MQIAWTAAPPGRRPKLHASQHKISAQRLHSKECRRAPGPGKGRLLSAKAWRTKAATKIVAGSVRARPAGAALVML